MQFIQDAIVRKIVKGGLPDFVYCAIVTFLNTLLLACLFLQAEHNLLAAH